jgi:hypothetical protein
LSTWEPGALVAFIAVRLDEDEAAVNAAARKRRPPWRAVTSADGLNGFVSNSPEGAVGTAFDRGHVAGAVSGAVAVYIAWNDPGRALREVEAKRAILADCQLAVSRQREFNAACARYGSPFPAPHANLAFRTLLQLAAIWNDHPDYRTGRA